MILRRVTQHVREQNWTAIAIDFVIVVTGVFIGIQVSNWNATQAEHTRERLLLGELRAELAESIEQLNIKRNAFAQVARSGERAVAFLDAGDGCGDTCWSVLVDFFHASQWQQIIVAHPGVHAALTEWAGFTAGLDAAIVGQIAAAERAIGVIDAELGGGS